MGGLCAGGDRAGAVRLVHDVGAAALPRRQALLAIANFLCALGVLILYTTDRGAGTSRGIQQAIYYGAGIIAMLACIFVVRHVRRWGFDQGDCWAAALLAPPLAIGTEQNGATN